MREPAVVSGGGIAGLVAADALAAGGRPVRLALPARGVGGGFLPLRRDGLRLELGVRLLELGYEDDVPSPALSEYSPGFGGHRPFTRLIAGWADGLVGDRLVDVPSPVMVVDGSVHDDVYFSVDLTGLPHVLGPRRAARVEAEALQADSRHGAAGLLAPHAARALDELTLEEASLANHGPTLHAALIAPPAEKFLAGGATRTLASWRRKVWMPLFWPRTVSEACNGTLSFRPRRRLSTVTGGGPGAIVEALLDRLRGAPNVTIEEAPAPALDADVLAWPAKDLFAAAGVAYAPERARSVIAWLDVAESDLLAGRRLVHVVDADNPVARMSDSGDAHEAGRCVVCVELRHDIEEDEIVGAAVRGLADAGLLARGAQPRPVFSGALATFDAPTAATRDAFAAARAALADRELAGLVVGGAAAPGADSFNEQVVAGLAAAERLA